MLRGSRITCSTSPAEKLWSVGLRSLSKQSASVRAAACLLQQQRQQQCHSFSTGLVKEKQPSAVTTSSQATLQCSSEGSVLGSAAKEAQRLSELAAQCRSIKEINSKAAAFIKPPTRADETTVEGALEGAQKLLLVTTRSSPLQDAIQNKQAADPDIKLQISCLHRAFLAVTSWCLNVVDTTANGDPRVLENALEVAQRAHQLQLPFILPLHQRLMVAIATYYDPQVHFRRARAPSRNHVRTPGGLILEIAERVCSSLGPQAITSSHFFRDALVALAERRRYNDVVAILKGMESQFHIVELELDTLAHLLAVLKVTVEEQHDSIQIPPSDNADFLELLNLLNPYVWKSMSNYKSLSDILAKHKVQQLREAVQEKGKTLGLSEDKIQSLIPPSEQESVLPTLPSHLANNNDESRKRSTVPKNKDELYDIGRWVYRREHYPLPDIGVQIEKLYQGKEYRYGKELERLILTRMADEDDCDDDDDDDDDSLESLGDRMEDDFPIDDDDLDTFPDEDDYFDEFSSDDDDDANGRG